MPLLSRQDLDFWLYDMLDTEGLLQHPRYSDHSRETFSQTLDTAEQVAEKYFAPHNRKADEQEPWFDGEQVHTLPEIKTAFQHYVASGLLNARLDFAEDGMQLPHVVAAACTGYVSCANPASAGYPFLTMAAANLIRHFASPELQKRYLPLMRTGQAAGTMALTEPDTGSSLADIRTSARPGPEGAYLIRGHKMYISGGDQDITDNIIHLVLAKIEGGPPGARGISLFLVPKWLLDQDGRPARRNDVKLAGLLHKMGYRGTTSTVLNFGEQGQCLGYLIGEPHQGLKYMFMMMNEARMGVGLGAAVIGYRGYSESLDYARQRPQGRHPSAKDPQSPPIAIIEHADVKRMLLAQKAYTEGAIALCLYANHLLDRIETGSDPEQTRPLQELLDLLTPVVKSWPSEYGPKANSLAIQVLGGAGYIRDYPVEQCYRDNRLNPIHEGTQGIQALDLLGRKVWQAGGRGMQTLWQEIDTTLQLAGRDPALTEYVTALRQALNTLQQTTDSLGSQLRQRGPDPALANATLYLSLLGHVVVAWLWLWQAGCASMTPETGADNRFRAGKLQACRFFFRWELPKIHHWARLLESGDDTCFNMQADWF